MIFSYADTGFIGTLVLIEIELQRLIPRFDIVGLPSSEVRESRERVQQGILNSGFKWPHKRIVANLSPADIKKRGAGFDLAFAVALLSCTRQIVLPSASLFVIGELQFSGKIIPVKESFKAMVDAVKAGIKYFILPKVLTKNLITHTIFKTCEFLLVDAMSELRFAPKWSKVNSITDIQSPASTLITKNMTNSDELGRSFADLYLTQKQKKMCEVIALGRHHLLLVGPPGVGKSACAIRIPTLEISLNEDELLEVMKMWTHDQRMLAVYTTHRFRPVRCPHHNASIEGMIGGASGLRGELSLAHNGVLFLDEILEYKSSTLQSLREPLDQHFVTISRASYSAEYPSKFQVIATSNFCPCGMRGEKDSYCFCSEQEIFKYWKRLGGPLYDRFEVKFPLIFSSQATPLATSERMGNTREMEQRILNGYKFSQGRGQDVHWNSLLTHTELDRLALESPKAIGLLADLKLTGMYSERGLLNTRKVARTIADLELKNFVEEAHVLEAKELVHMPMSTMAKTHWH